MIEVLISSAVVGIGMMGLVALMGMGLKLNDSTYMRTQATLMAYDFADRMRANRGSASLASSALGGAYDDLSLCNSAARAAGDLRACTYGSAITAGADMVSLDLSQWWSTLDGSALPNWYAGVSRSNDLFTIYVEWDDSRAQVDSGGGSRPSCLGLDADLPAGMEQVCVTTQL